MTTVNANQTPPATVAPHENSDLESEPKIGWLRRHRAAVIRTASTVIVLLVWEVYGRSVNPLLFSAPTAIFKALVELIETGVLLEALIESVQPFTGGLALAIVVGVIVGILIGRFAIIEEGTLHFLTALYAVPPVALVPVIILWFGLGFTAKVAFIFLIAVFPVLFNTHDGIRAISRQHVDVAKAYGASEWTTLTSVVVPAALPFIMSGFRQSTGRALIGLIVAELFTGISGLGAMIVNYSNSLETAKVFAVVVVLGLLGIGLMSGGSWVERKVAPWKTSERAW